MRIRSPEEIARERRDYENEADVLMDEMADIAPLDLAREMMLKRDTFDMDFDAIPHVAEILRGRQSEWLKGRRWPLAASLPGRPELQRTRDHAQDAPPDDIDDGVIERST